MIAKCGTRSGVLAGRYRPDLIAKKIKASVWSITFVKEFILIMV